MIKEKHLQRLRARAANADPAVAETMNGVPCIVEAIREPMRAIAGLCVDHGRGAGATAPSELLPPLP